MIDSFLRRPYQNICIDPALHFIRKKHISPHTITLFALLSGLAIPFSLFFHSTYLALALLLFSGYCDTLDGSLARFLNTSSPKGAVFDIVSDRAVEFAILLGLYLFAPAPRALYIILMCGAILLCVTSFLVVGIFSENEGNKSFHYSPGLMERSEAFLFFAAMILFPTYFSLLAIAFITLVLLTAMLRVWEFSKK